MRYREPMEIIIRGRERERVTLVPVPSLPGHWMPCHQAVVVGCPKCGAGPNVPCFAGKGGAFAFTKGMVNVIRRLAHGDHVTPSQLQDVRERVNKAQTYQREVHGARKRAWVDAGLRHPRSKHKKDWG